MDGKIITIAAAIKKTASAGYMFIDDAKQAAKTWKPNG